MLIGSSPFASAGKSRPSSQAGLIVLIADNAESHLLRGEATTLSPLVWEARRSKCAVLSNLPAEATAAVEAVKSGDAMRVHIVEAMQGIEDRNHKVYQSVMGMVQVTSCKSIHDLVNKRGTAA